MNVPSINIAKDTQQIQLDKYLTLSGYLKIVVGNVSYIKKEKKI